MQQNFFLKQFFNESSIKNFENILMQNNCKKSIGEFVQTSAAIGCIFFIAFVVLAFFLKIEMLVFAVFSVCAFVAGFCSNFLFHFYLFDLRRKEIEKFVPDLLLSASIFPAGESIYKIIDHFSKTSYGAISGEFEKCRQEILNGNSAPAALLNLKKRVDSQMLSRAVDLIISGVNSGADAAAIFKETAEDLFETSSILRERNASLIIEKYTLLFAGAVIVPAILGTIGEMVLGLDFDALSEVGIGLALSQKEKLIESILFSTPIYIAEYALIASFFVAFQESDLKKGIVYAAIILPLSLAVYYFLPSFF